MIWPFRPYPPLPLKLKVACERRWAIVARMIGASRAHSAATAVPPGQQQCNPLVAKTARTVDGVAQGLQTEGNRDLLPRSFRIHERQAVVDDRGMPKTGKGAQRHCMSQEDY